MIATKMKIYYVIYIQVKIAKNVVRERNRSLKEGENTLDRKKMG